MDYTNKIILAPMVRCGTLAFRLLALEYGADIVYSEEIIDYKMIHAKRCYNEITNTIDYTLEGFAKPIFQTCEKEKGKVVFQMGTCDPERALKVCKLIEDDVSAIDINMGCPKEFSVKGGMGSALLKKPDLVKEILETLVNGSSKPITCKIRCLPTIEETINLCKLIEKCGVKAICVHGRFQNERSTNPNHNDFIKEIATQIKIPIIANGGSNNFRTYKDFESFKNDCGVSSLMVARAAMWNCSIFCKDGPLPLDDVMKRFLEICLETDNFFYNTKYVIQQMLHEELQTPRGFAVLASQSGDEIYQLLDMLEIYKKKTESMSLLKKKQEIITIKRKSDFLETNSEDNLKKEDILTKKSKHELDLDSLNPEIICMPTKFVKKDFRDGTRTPKSILHTYTLDKLLPRPIYSTEEKKPERIYRSIVEVNGIKYTAGHWELNKQSTEQAAAIVCLEFLKIDYLPKPNN